MPLQTSWPTPDDLHDLVIVKLGGSVVTDKTSVDTFNSEVTSRLARELREVCGPLIIVHGTGSYGKPLAIKYNYLSGFLDPSRPEIAALAQHKDRLLHIQVLEVCLKQGLNVTSLPPSALFCCKQGDIRDIHLDALIRHLKAGLIPVIYGDLVVDDIYGFSVCSSDNIVLALSRVFRTRLVVFASDVDGVYANNPNQAQANELVYEFTGNAAIAHTDDKFDVSGGMRQKVAVAQKIAQASTECWIINGQMEGRLGALLCGDRVVGTRFSTVEG